MRCPTCGTENAASRAQCARCGARLRGGTARVSVARTTVGTPEAQAALMAGLRGDLRRLLLVTVMVVTVVVALGVLLR
jgi:uncharacterized membrane protein YvbJ